MWSKAGVQQGDPFGPLLFSLALHVLVQRLGAFPSMKQRWYLDDGCISGPIPVLREVFALIQAQGPSLGLFINPAKCLLSTPAAQPSFPSEVPRAAWDAGCTILGTPVGSEAFVAGQLQAPLSLLQVGLERLTKLDESHAAFLLLRYCFGACRITHSMSTVFFPIFFNVNKHTLWGLKPKRLQGLFFLFFPEA